MIFILPFIFIFIAISAYFLFDFQRKSKSILKEQLMKIERLEKELADSKIEPLQQALSPHLFKNVLNTVQSNAFKTYFALEKITEVLDFVLYESRKGMVSFNDEINFARNLTEVYKLKLNPMFSFTFKVNIDEKYPYLIESKLILPMISIDIIENCFKHTNFQKNDAFISINFSVENGVFSIVAANSVAEVIPIKKSRSGYGLNSLMNRLNVFYPDGFSFKNFVENGVHFTELKINLLDYHAKMYPVG